MGHAAAFESTLDDYRTCDCIARAGETVRWKRTPSRRPMAVRVLDLHPLRTRRAEQAIVR